MTFNHIVIQNLRHNLKHYAIYLLSLLFSIVLYFSFSTLQYTDSINNPDAINIIQKGASIGAIFLFIIIVVFLMYANHLFIKRRTTEFALFQLIGLTKGNILRLLLLEQCILFVTTGIIGVLCGILGAQLLAKIISSMLHLTTTLNLHFEVMAVIQTLMMLAAAFILIIFQSFFFLKRRSILTMLKDRNTSDATHSKISIMETLSGILGILMVAFGYYIAVEMFGTFKELTLHMWSPFIILILTVVGTYLFFRSSVSLIFKLLKRAKHGFISITDVVFTSSMMYRMKKHAMSLTIMAIISAVTVTMLCFATLSQSASQQNINSTAPNDFNTSSTKASKQFEQRLKDQNIKFKKVMYEALIVNSINNDVITLKNGSDAEMTLVTIARNSKLKGHQAIVTNTDSLPNVMRVNLNQHLTVKGKQRITFKATKVDNQKTYPLDLSHNMAVIEVSPNAYQALKTSSITSQYYGYDVKDKNKLKQASQLATQTSNDITNRQEEKAQMDATVGTLIFVTSFLGLAFLIATGCIIYIKQVDETEDELNNYRILKRLGFDQRDMLPGLTLKISFNFGLPLLVAILHAIFAAIAFAQLLGKVSYQPTIVVILLYTVIYLIFALFAFVHSNRMIKSII